MSDCHDPRRWARGLCREQAEDADSLRSCKAPCACSARSRCSTGHPSIPRTPLRPISATAAINLVTLPGQNICFWRHPCHSCEHCKAAALASAQGVRGAALHALIGKCTGPNLAILGDVELAGGEQAAGAEEPALPVLGGVEPPALVAPARAAHLRVHRRREEHLLAVPAGHMHRCGLCGSKLSLDLQVHIRDHGRFTPAGLLVSTTRHGMKQTTNVRYISSLAVSLNTGNTARSTYTCVPSSRAHGQRRKRKSVGRPLLSKHQGGNSSRLAGGCAMPRPELAACCVASARCSASAASSSSASYARRLLASSSVSAACGPDEVQMRRTKCGTCIIAAITDMSIYAVVCTAQACAAC